MSDPTDRTGRRFPGFQDMREVANLVFSAKTSPEDFTGWLTRDRFFDGLMAICTDDNPVIIRARAKRAAVNAVIEKELRPNV